MRTIKFTDKEYLVLRFALIMLDETDGFENAMCSGIGSPKIEEMMETFKSILDKVRQ
jgi:hypothetical protein